MRYIIYGAGAIGGVIGARLFQAGHDVILVARGPHLAAIQRHGITFRTPDESQTLPIPAVAHPRELQFTPSDVVILTMKSHDSEVALRDLRACGGRDLPIVCAQNGVENERLAARCFPRVYGTMVWLPALSLEPGLVLNYARPVSGILDAGRYPAGVDDLILGVTSDLDASGFSSRPQLSIMRWKYAKLLVNMAVTVMALCPRESDTGAFVESLWAEAVACYRAAGIDFASEAEERERREACGIEMAPIEGAPRMAGSTWQSLERRRGNIETDYINGEIVLLGRLHGVSTPYNRAVQETANRLARDRQAPESVRLEDLERLTRAFAGAYPLRRTRSEPAGRP